MSEPGTRGRRFAGATREFQRLLTGVHTLVYRLSDGQLGGRLVDTPILLLSTVGRRSGRLRVTPLTYYQDDGRFVLVASNGGTAGSPGWYHNLVASPRALIRIGGRVFDARAKQIDAADRARLWPLVAEMYPGYREYQTRTDREIPLIRLEARGEGQEARGKRQEENAL